MTTKKINLPLFSACLLLFYFTPQALSLVCDNQLSNEDNNPMHKMDSSIFSPQADYDLYKSEKVIQQYLMYTYLISQYANIEDKIACIISTNCSNTDMKKFGLACAGCPLLKKNANKGCG